MAFSRGLYPPFRQTESNGTAIRTGNIAFNEREADVDRVPEKYPGERRGNHSNNTSLFDGDRGLLPGRAAPEVLACHDHRPSESRGESGIEILENMCTPYAPILCSEIPTGNYDIGVDIGRKAYSMSRVLSGRP